MSFKTPNFWVFYGLFWWVYVILLSWFRGFPPVCNVLFGVIATIIHIYYLNWLLEKSHED